ncbi:hypothetical protein QTH91_10725 [Variovorax dokdonensis]|uniref:Lysine-specific metallo-endopeptidase domain-containing protein n=1 Tax=Variovorax dokdonensis TaxID=344883 RepID=A0ABT7NAR9_9BURK|nr:hypothetical protein [Variovorax dokdonensis]MDM0044960.1 hypothetical protein [Variovorax dokdonensis]
MSDKKQSDHLDTRAVIAAGLVIKYHSDRPPGMSTKTRLCKSASISRSAMRSTVWQIDKIVLFGADEPDWMVPILDRHFCLNRDNSLSSELSGKKLKNAKARRKYLADVRTAMLSTSFHLNTGMYLLDVDAKHRMSVGDFHIDNMGAGWAELDDAGKKVVSRNIEGYVQGRTGLKEKFGVSSSGGIHVGFSLFDEFGYSPEMMARIIIHEATHKFCKTADVKYCWDANYDHQTPQAMKNNADSLAYAAMSISAKKVLDSGSLPTHSHDT